jgi:hypothetical protein
MTNTSSGNFYDTNQGQKNKLPQFLNVLTIITLVGCAIELISSVWRFTSAEKSYNQVLEAQKQMEGAPDWVKKMAGPEALEIARKTVENKTPLLLVTLAGTALCLWGALEMRKLKKQGFLLWTVGEFLPIIGSVIILGTGVFSGLAAFILLFPIIFLIMYAVNRKHLIY